MSQLIQAGLNVTAIGMGVVFVLLTLLVWIIRGMSALAHAIGGVPGQPAAPSTASSPSTHSDQQLVGVISAAIAAHRARHRSDPKGN